MKLQQTGLSKLRNKPLLLHKMVAEEAVVPDGAELPKETDDEAGLVTPVTT